MILRKLFLVIFFMGWAYSVSATALDDYVAAPDPNYAYTLVNTISEATYTANVYSMTSQAWLSPSDVDPHIWRHWLTIIVPDTVSHTKALLWLHGGSIDEAPPLSVNDGSLQAASATHSIVADLRMVPNQPTLFAADTHPVWSWLGRSENELLAFGFDKYKKSLDASAEDPEWLPLLPMTKATIRAMDTVQAEHPSITGFMGTGESKRGMTIWLAAAVDARMEAIAPRVHDLLNLEINMQHQFDFYGKWPQSLDAFVEMGNLDWLHTPEFRTMMAIIDPYAYRDRYTIPKFLINAANDQFFVPDSSQFYFEDLMGEKHLRYVPNANHYLNQEANDNFIAYYYAYLNGVSRPEYSWEQEPDGSLRVQTVTSPTAVRLWQATNEYERNFKLNEVTYTSSPLTDQGGGLYIGAVPEPAKGWTAFFVELEFPSGGPYPFKFTTEVSVIPKEERPLGVANWTLFE